MQLLESAARDSQQTFPKESSGRGPFAALPMQLLE